MDIIFSPPKLEGSTEERLTAFENWAKKLCEELNIMFDEMKGGHSK